MPASLAARAICPTLPSNSRMLPGLTRTAAQPASMALKTYFGWKWMSAMTGSCDLRTIVSSASASTGSGTATRTIWQPVAVSSAICCKVALMSAVTVVVIDCTLIGAPPPTRTPPDVELTGLPALREPLGHLGHAQADRHWLIRIGFTMSAPSR